MVDCRELSGVVAVVLVCRELLQIVERQWNKMVDCRELSGVVAVVGSCCKVLQDCYVT